MKHERPKNKKVKLTRSRSLFLLCCCLYLSSTGNAQSLAPGGVDHPKLWISSNSSPNGQIIWKDMLTGQVISQMTRKEDNYLNFNPAFTFDHSIPSPGSTISGLNSEKWTLFTAYQSRDTFSEKSIWSYAQNGQTKGILTTRRMANLEQFEYLNFPGKISGRPQINTYLHYQDKTENTLPASTTLLLVEKPRDWQLPITSFRGKIPEVILYERVLSPEERQRVESYLAIKYGTNLAPEQQLDYLNARGNTLYAPSKSGEFIHRITGIGRDDLSGLYQKRSSSSYAPGLLTIGLQVLKEENSIDTHPLPDQHFLLWADNKETLDWQEKQALQPQFLHRRWQIQATGSWETVSTELQFDTHQLRTTARQGETYWLIIDRNGKGDFATPNALDYYPLQHMAPNGQAHFQNIHWDTDHSGRDFFTIATGPEFMALANIYASQCSPAKNGRLQVRALGGRAPYQYQLKQNGLLFQKWVSDGKEYREIADLPAGAYELQVMDADHKVYREEFFLQSSDAPKIKLAHSYQLPKDQILHLDATTPTGSVLSYEWQLPDGAVKHTAQLEIKQSGIYTLRVDEAGCVTQQTIMVIPAPSGNFRRLSLFPNPSSDGNFQARIHLEREADLQLKIYDPTGRLLVERQLYGSSYYHTGEQLSGKGTYLIQFRSQDDQITIPFIVQ